MQITARDNVKSIIEINVKNHRLQLEIKYDYSISGKHYAETRLTPEEFPEININNYQIFISGNWRYCPEWLEDLIEDKYIMQFIESAWESQKSAKYDAAVHKAEMRADR